jgi:hypothetical protein
VSRSEDFPALQLIVEIIVKAVLLVHVVIELGRERAVENGYDLISLEWLQVID